MGYKDTFYNIYGGSPKPDHHTAGYMNGFNAGLAARNSGHPSLKSSSAFPCVGGTGVEYCSGYHDGAVQREVRRILLRSYLACFRPGGKGLKGCTQ